MQSHANASAGCGAQTGSSTPDQMSDDAKFILGFG
jgi:hypothetical protein